LSGLFSTPKITYTPETVREPVYASSETEKAAVARRKAEATRLKGEGREATKLTPSTSKVLGS